MHTGIKNAVVLIIAMVTGACLAACSGQPAQTTRPAVTPNVPVGHTSASTPSVGYQVAGTALELVGVPYRYGGQTPSGFDCSGLVYYTYSRVGVRVPRTSRDQFRSSQAIPVGKAQPGDLLFFRIGGQVSHVGIYLGDGQFVHAPASGQQVTVNRLSDTFYRQHFERAGRLIDK